MEVCVAIAGCGVLARDVHIPLLERMEGVRVVAIADAHPETLAKAKALLPSAEAYSDYQSMLSYEGLQAVFVTLPTHLHFQAAKAVLESDLHLYLEKPAASELEDAATVKNSWLSQQQRKVAMMGFNFRREPLIEDLRNSIHRGSIGEIKYLHSVFTQSPESLPSWKLKRETGGGVLLDLGSHHLDLWEDILADEIVEIHASLWSQKFENDNATVEAVTRQGVRCHGYFSFTSAFSHRLEAYGVGGRLTADLMTHQRLQTTAADTRHVRLKLAANAVRNGLAVGRLKERYRSPWSTPSYERAIRVFLQGVRSGRQMRPDLRDGYRALELVVAAEESATTNVPVDTSGRSFL